VENIIEPTILLYYPKERLHHLTSIQESFCNLHSQERRFIDSKWIYGFMQENQKPWKGPLACLASVLRAAD